MLCVKTKILPSAIHGIGLFADEFISKGTVVWEFVSSIDTVLLKEDVLKLSFPAQKQLRNYAFLDIKRNMYVLCGDDGRFFNHSQSPNCDERVDDVTTAMRDIFPGEEMTVDYRTFYGDMDDHPEVLQDEK